MSSDCCGPKNLACSCTQNQPVYKKEWVCKSVRRERVNSKLVLTTTEENRKREIKKTVMVPYNETVKQLRTVQKPVKRNVERQRIDYKTETSVVWDDVSERVRVAVPKPSCGCFKTTCGCQGQANCGCCAPKCGCAPPQIEYAYQTITKKVPRAIQTRVPIMTPYQEEVVQMVDEQILHNVEVTKMRPRIVLENIDEIIPVYRNVRVETREPYFEDECKWELVADGVQAVVQQLTMEKV